MTVRMSHMHELSHSVCQAEEAVTNDGMVADEVQESLVKL